MKEIKNADKKEKGMKHPYMFNLLHIVITGITWIGMMVVQAFFPMVILPKVQIPMLVLLTLIPLCLESYLNVEKGRNLVVSTLIGGATFFFLLCASGLAVNIPLWKLFGVGILVVGLTDILYQSAAERSMGVKPRLVPVVNSLMLFLACQSFMALL